MKTRNKALLLALCAVVLVVATVFGTLAYLTATTKEVVNTFTVGNVKITLDEAKVDEYGKPVAGAERVMANTYKLIPNHSYTKDPTVHVANDSEDCWVFVKIENGIAGIEGGTTVAEQMTAKGWTLINETSNIYAHKDIHKAGDDVVVFENFTVNGVLKNEEIAGYADKSIKVTGYAVQADGFDTAADAWNATFGAPTTPAG